MSTYDDINTLIQIRRSAEQRSEVLSQQLADVKNKILEIDHVLLPELMMNVGLTRVTTSTGVEIEIKPWFDAKMTNEAFVWLRANGHGSLIKSEVSVPVAKDDALYDKLINLLRNAGIDYESVESVHPQTLKAFVREMNEKGKPVPSDAFQLRTGSKAYIKNK